MATRSAKSSIDFQSIKLLLLQKDSLCHVQIIASSATSTILSLFSFLVQVKQINTVNDRRGQAYN